MLDASSVRIVCRHVLSLANTGGQFMRFHVTSFFIFGLLIHTSAANACEEHHEEMYAEWAIEGQEGRPHAEGPMIPSVDSSEFLVDLDEDGAPVGTARLRLDLNSGTIDPNLCTDIPRAYSRRLHCASRSPSPPPRPSSAPTAWISSRRCSGTSPATASLPRRRCRTRTSKSSTRRASRPPEAA